MLTIAKGIYSAVCVLTVLGMLAFFVSQLAVALLMLITGER